MKFKWQQSGQAPGVHEELSKTQRWGGIGSFEQRPAGQAVA